MAISEATVIQIGAKGVGKLQADDEYGYGNHDINQLFFIDAI
ncbi:hypothetical protein ACK39A_11150 [Aeromonas veronii]